MTPAMLIEMLASFRGRLRRLSLLYGIGVTLAVVGGVIAGMALLDWAFHLARFWRLVLLCGAISAVALIVVRHLLRPLRSRLPVTDIAGRIESLFPQLQDRLRSAVGFIQSPTPDSPAMQQATVDQAINLASTLPLRSVIDPRPALRSLAGGLAVVVAVALCAALMDPATRSILASRVFNPLSARQWPKRVQIALEPIAARVPAGGRVEVQMRLARGDSAKLRPIVFYENAAGAMRQEFMTRGDDGRFTASLDAQTESDAKGGAMKVWIVAGDDRTEPAAVQIVPRLVVETFSATVAPPAYVKQPTPTDVNLMTQQASGLIGSTVQFTLRFSKPIAGADKVRLLPLADGTMPAIAWQPSADAQTFRGQMRLENSMRFRVDAVDIDGFDVASSSEFEVVARPDQLPAIFIQNPRRSEEQTVDATVPLIGMAEDDAGIRDVALVVNRLGQSQQAWTIPLMTDGLAAPSAAQLAWTRVTESGDRERFRVDYAWLLAALPEAKLKPGDVLEYFLRASDNYDLDGQRHPPVETAKLRVTIISQEELSNRVADELRQVKQQVEQIKQQHDRTAAETQSFKGDVKGKPQLDQADSSVANRLQQQQSSVASATRSAADRLQEVRRVMDENKSPSTDLQQLTKDVGERLTQTSEGPMKAALQNLSEAAQPAEDAARQQRLERSNESQKQASDELADTLRRLEDIGSLNAMIDNLQKMLDAQRGVTNQTKDIAARNAGKTPEQMSKPDRDQLEKLAAEQAKLADATQKALERLGKTADQLNKTDPASAEAMRQAQKQGSRQNVSQNQKQASQQMRQNQQKNARQSQQQAEVGLEVMLNQLREAQKHKLAELQKKLAELQQQIEILVRRQSGHNLDNLTLQGEAVLTAQEMVVADLRTRSARKPGEDRPELPRLLTGQGQTERNTRDIARRAADVPDGAEPASRLTRAATLMERAAVNLRDKKLPDAYEPPQLDALATLDEARRLIDEQKDKVDDEIAQQENEAIRQAYVRIKGEQEKLADDTRRLDGARDAKGELNRADLVRLGQLPTEQQKLAEDVRKVGEQLASLKSTVFVWANKQIEGAMGDVKAELAAGKTAAGTHRQHTRIIADLQAMIDNLKIAPREKKFESGGGGGSGGGESQAPPMPPEAELRLMKSLQQVVNGSTVEVNDAIKRAGGQRTDEQNEALVTTGRRQSQLRTLLSDLMAKATQGQAVLGPEPKDPKPLDEEATLQQVDDQELEQELLGGKPGSKDDEIDVRRIGDRMARSRQRLEIDRDPGRITQVIQQRIVKDFDLLIEAARKQAAECKGGGTGKPQPGAEPKPGDQQAQNQGKNASPSGTNAAGESTAGGVTGTQANAGKNIAETAEEWGRISPRLRGPVLESRDEAIVERYRRLIEDYTQAVSTEASGGSGNGNGGGGNGGQ